MRKFLAVLPLLALGACQVGADALNSVGVTPATAQTISTDAAIAGQLFCTDGQSLLTIPAINVSGATAATVAKACAAAIAVGATTPPANTPVPISAPAGVQAIVAVVPAAVAAAVTASAKS